MGRHALIAGAGIGGLSCALALHRRGWSVEIFERSPRLSEVGAGIQLGPNACRLFEGWGLLDALQSVAFEPEVLESRDWRQGDELNLTPLGQAARQRWGAPYLQVHRADLQDLLVAALQNLPQVQIHLDHAVTAVDADRGQLQAGGASFNGDLIIGADGIRSAVRDALIGPVPARYTGQSAWRFTLPTSQLPANLIPPRASLWMGPGKHLVHYYVRSGDCINVVGVTERKHWKGSSWTEPAAFDDLRADFADAHPQIRTLVAAAADQECYRWALHDMPALPQWSRGRATLLGDACHATLPFLAQGAAMAIEDAAVLAACLQTGSAIEPALQHYQDLRQPRTRWVQQASRRNARIFHLRGPLAAARNLSLRSGLASPAALTERLYRYDAASVC